MSFKITKKRIIQAWIEETVNLINITLAGKEIPINIEKLPPQLREDITVKENITASSSSRGLIISSEITERLRRSLDLLRK